MRQTLVSLTPVTAGSQSSVIPLDPHITPFNVGFCVVVKSVTSAISYSVEHTFEDPFSDAGLTAATKWFRHSTVSATIGDADGNYAFPVMAVRVSAFVTSSGSAGGSLEFRVIQAGI
jgi:hypothetical protein